MIVNPEASDDLDMEEDDPIDVESQDPVQPLNPIEEVVVEDVDEHLMSEVVTVFQILWRKSIR